MRFLPGHGCLGVQSKHFWSRASVGGVQPSAHFLLLQSHRVISRDSGRGGRGCTVGSEKGVANA